MTQETIGPLNSTETRAIMGEVYQVDTKIDRLKAAILSFETSIAKTRHDIDMLEDKKQAAILGVIRDRGVVPGAREFEIQEAQGGKISIVLTDPPGAEPETPETPEPEAAPANPYALPEPHPPAADAPKVSWPWPPIEAAAEEPCEPPPEPPAAPAPEAPVEPSAEPEGEPAPPEAPAPPPEPAEEPGTESEATPAPGE